MVADADRAEEHAFGYCLRRLTSAARTEHDLAGKLRERGYEDGVVDAVLGRLRRLGYVDDAQFADQWVRSRSRSKALAAPMLRQELRRKGVDEELIEAALRDGVDSDDDARALALLRRKLPGVLPAERSELDRLKRRLGGMLARKGYDGARVWRLVDAALSETGQVASVPTDE
ncbi:regulatory protein RecX [Cumulibacter manganitolerans]|uniref:regulatory protein RecX n=1 Tax=Cumulibacter manganitolerans TaxID=1884992 RepID=UPI00129690EE|nr:regulatory protein RecX [Cumulibacter manganitolerans]